METWKLYGTIFSASALKMVHQLELDLRWVDLSSTLLWSGEQSSCHPYLLIIIFILVLCSMFILIASADWCTLSMSPF